MIKCLIVDDEPFARNLLEQYILKVPFLSLLRTCSNPLEAIEVLRENEIDLLFLDVQMPEITGITLLKVLHKKPLVILTTAYSEYALEGYELDVVDYLLKPITLERFLKAVEKANQRLNPSSTNKSNENNIIEKNIPEKIINTDFIQPFVFVKDGTKLVKIRLNEILFVEGLKDYVTIHTKSHKIVSLQRLKTLETQLPAEQFIRIHHSYIISLESIDAIFKEKVQIGTAYLPISDTYRKSFKDFIEKNHL